MLPSPFAGIAGFLITKTQKERGKRVQSVEMTYLNGKSCRIEKFGKLFDCSLDPDDSILLSFHIRLRPGPIPNEICLSVRVFFYLRDFIQFREGRKVCRVWNHNIYPTQTSSTSKYFSPNEIPRVPQRNRCA